MTAKEMAEIKKRIANAIADELANLAAVAVRVDQEIDRLNEPKKEKLSQHDVAREKWVPSGLPLCCKCGWSHEPNDACVVPEKNTIAAEQAPPKYFLLDAQSTAAARFFEATRWVQSHAALVPGTDGVTLVGSTVHLATLKKAIEITVNTKAPNAEAIVVALSIAAGVTLLSQQDVRRMAGQI